MDKSQYIGITETGEVAFNLDVFDRLYAGNIIITKRLTDKLIEKLVEHKEKIILHLTCTGWGGSVIEPMVPDVDLTYNKFIKLIDSGFPVEQVVLRIDPVIPTVNGLERLRYVLHKFKETGIKRIRYSVLDMYKHVIERFKEAGVMTPYETFHAPRETRLKIYHYLKEFCDTKNISLEACAEPDVESCSCLSQKDIDILGLSDLIELEGSAEQRKTCGCPANKHELLRVKPQQCSNGCLYCFWKDNHKKEKVNYHEDKLLV